MIKSWPIFLLPILVFAGVSRASAEESSCGAGDQFSVSKIDIFGNERVKDLVIQRELGFTEGEVICEVLVEQAMGRIRRMGIFSKVSHQIQRSDEAVVLSVQVEERWTTIPIVKFSSGGGVSQYTVGVYDPNVFGEFLEAGAQYENLGGAGSGVVWFKNPRLYGQRQGVDLQYWNTKRIRIKYDQDVPDPLVKRAFLHEREKLFAEYSKELARQRTVRFSVEVNRDVFSENLVPKTLLEKIGVNPQLPPATQFALPRGVIELGQVEGDSHALDGQLLSGSLTYGHSLNQNAESFLQGDFAFHLFKVPQPGWQFAQRILVGSSTTKVLQYWYYLGGLDRIRGFSDNRFSGRHYVLNNSEARYLMLERPSVMLQGVGSLDAAAIGEEVAALSEIRAASLGIGLRFILPKFYRFVIRVDSSRAIVRNDAMNLSFGVQQFF